MQAGLYRVRGRAAQDAEGNDALCCSRQVRAVGEGVQKVGISGHAMSCKRGCIASGAGQRWMQRAMMRCAAAGR